MNKDLFNVQTTHPLIQRKQTYVLHRKLVSIHSDDRDLNKSSASLVINGEIFKLYFDQDVDLVKIKNTLEKKVAKINDEMKKISSRLSNKGFIDKAPANIIEQENSNYANLEKDVKKIQLTLKGL